MRAVVLALLVGSNAHAQQPVAPVPAPVPVPAPAPAVPVELVTFSEAVRRASTANPSIAIAAANILRAEGLLRQARAAALPTINAQGTNTTLDSGRGFNDQQLTSRNTFSASIPVEMPLFAPVAWAQRAQAQDARHVAQADADDVRRQVALAAAQAYLAVIAAHRVVEVQERSRDTAEAFYDFAHQRFVAGASSKLNELRAKQTFSSDQAAVEDAQLALYRTQEALGVLLAADRPVDAAEEPAIESPPESEIFPAIDRSLGQRTDIKLFTLEVQAARRVVDDSRKEWLPSLTGIFQPEFQQPGSVFTPAAGWRALLQISMPLFDSGLRSGRRVERQAALQQSEATLVAQRRQATSEIRSAYEAVRRSERVVQSTRDAASQAAQVLEITNISFRAGATTNIEVIDAQRRARDADTAAAIAEDVLRRARLDLLNALGRFP